MLMLERLIISNRLASLFGLLPMAIPHPLRLSLLHLAPAFQGLPPASRQLLGRVFMLLARKLYILSKLAFRCDLISLGDSVLLRF